MPLPEPTPSLPVPCSELTSHDRLICPPSKIVTSSFSSTGGVRFPSSASATYSSLLSLNGSHEREPLTIGGLWFQEQVLGAASMATKTGKHPGQLKDEVKSPGGTSVAGIHELREGCISWAIDECSCCCFLAQPRIVLDSCHGLVLQIEL